MSGSPVWPTRSEGQNPGSPDGAALGNFGDCEPVGEGVSEMRIHVGPGYRVYYVRTGSTVYVLLAGGTKASQAKDITKAKRMARELRMSKQRRSEP
jgi:putative component of toxin-antitoxin plasmid stabilization module